MHAARERSEAFLDRRQFGAADDADDRGAAHRCREQSGEIRRIRKAERHPGEILRGGVPAGGHVDRFRKLRRNTSSRVLKLEAMPEHEIESSRSIRAKVFFEVGRCFCLNMAYLRPQTISDEQQPLVGATVPGLIGDRPGS